MALNFLNTAGRVPTFPDSTRDWAERSRKNGLLKPQLLLRFATDTNYIRTSKAKVYGTSKVADTKAMMNLTLPGMKLPGILNWSVSESLDQVTQTASFECLNCLPISTRSGILQTGIAQRPHSGTLNASYVANSLFVTEKVTGGSDVETHKDSQGYYLRESGVQYRTFDHELFTIDDASKWPLPQIPNDDDNDVSDMGALYPSSNSGAGSYFVLIDQEIIRVCRLNGNQFSIPSGGRGINGITQEHAPGAKVQLLGFAPYTGQWTALGYLNVNDYAVQTAILRPGTVLVSYEGYGDIKGQNLSGARFGLTHDYNVYDNYTFTGYWFITGVEPSFAEDGVPKVKVNLAGVGQLYDQQKISPDLVRRIKNQFDQWRIGEDNATIWGAADHSRDIPGDWVDYNSWDPTLPGSYPLQIKTEFAQHKEFFDHMTDTEYGIKCEICRQEHSEWLKTHKGGGALAFVEQRAVGRHIYKQSIRVLGEEAGPIKTYIRLMSTIAAAAWDHPAQGTELAQRFTKLPNTLFDNIRNLGTGLVFNGQIMTDLPAADPQFDWFTPGYDDRDVISKRGNLTCPFEAQYDNVPFSQPMTELAEANGCFFWINRQGYPVFKPRLFSARPGGQGWRDLDAQDPYPAEKNEWFASYGASISGYSPSINVADALTQVWITATTAFDTQMTVLAAGTGFKGGKRVAYSALGGNREALSLTSGVQQLDTISLDNQVLGMDWNTKAGWGVTVIDANGDPVLAAKPELYDGAISIDGNNYQKYTQAVRRIQQTLNFFLVRKYTPPFQYKGQWTLKVTVDGKYGGETQAGVDGLRQFLGLSSSKIYTRATYTAIKAYIDGHDHFIKTDIFWYVANKKSWEEYVASVTGVPVPVRNTGVKGKDGQPDYSDYTPDQALLNQEREVWTKSFAKIVSNVGNRRVDEQLDRASVRSITSNIADPRILPGDVIWCEIPGFLGATKNTNGDMKPPFLNGIYVTQIDRQMDLQQGTYTASYSGFRYRGEFNRGLPTDAINKGYDFL